MRAQYRGPWAIQDLDATANEQFVVHSIGCGCCHEEEKMSHAEAVAYLKNLLNEVKQELTKLEAIPVCTRDVSLYESGEQKENES